MLLLQELAKLVEQDPDHPSDMVKLAVKAATSITPPGTSEYNRLHRLGYQEFVHRTGALSLQRWCNDPRNSRLNICAMLWGEKFALFGTPNSARPLYFLKEWE